VGGPILKNKLFFFGGFNNEIVSTRSLFSTGLVTPTPAGLATLAAWAEALVDTDAVGDILVAALVAVADEVVAVLSVHLGVDPIDPAEDALFVAVAISGFGGEGSGRHLL